MHYRKDIDGLRAIAVLIVVFYHYGIPGFSGGYVGVDVFFVISGYLITSILVKDLQAAKFSIAHFYERRIRRIFPALFALIAGTAVVGWLLLFPFDLRDFGQSVAALAAFSSNILFFMESGYFNAASEEKPLLHTWSLSVEEQFYLFFPVILFLLYKYSRKHLLHVIWGIFFVSLAWSIARTPAEPAASFFLLHTRAWELMLGALLALKGIPAVEDRTIRNVLSFGGLLLILYSTVFYSAQTPFPGYQALAPCVGTMLLIHTNRTEDTLAGTFLSTRLMVFVGLLSYSLYLWHWPVIVFFRHYNIEHPVFYQRVIGIIISFALAYLSWRFVETPFRSPAKKASRRLLFATTAGILLLFFSYGLFLHKSLGAPFRLSPEQREILSVKVDSLTLRSNYPELWGISVDEDTVVKIHNSTAGETFFVWGDSHAHSMVPVFKAVAQQTNSTGLIAWVSGTFPSPFLRPVTDERLRFTESALSFIKGSPAIKTVFLSGYWNSYVDTTLPYDVYKVETASAALAQTIRELKKAGKRVVIIADLPVPRHDVPKTMARTETTGKQIPLASSREEYIEKRSAMFGEIVRIAKLEGADVIDPLQAFCPTEMCLTELNGKSLYYDNNHLSEAGAMLLKEDILQYLSR